MGLFSMKDMKNFTGLGKDLNMSEVLPYSPDKMDDDHELTIRNVSRANPSGFTDGYGLGDYLGLVTMEPENDSLMDTMTTGNQGAMR